MPIRKSARSKMAGPISLAIGGGGAGGVPTYWDNVTSVWEFEGDTADSSGYLKDEIGNYHLTLPTGTPPSKVAGHVGTDARFNTLGNSSTGGVKSAGLGFVQATANVTFMGWFKPEIKALGYCFHLGQFGQESTGYGFSIYWQQSGTQVVLAGTSNSATVALAKSGLAAETWHHIAFTWIGSTNTLRFFVNGVAVGTKNDWGANMFDAGTNNPVLGLCLSNTSPGGSGAYDAVRFWKTEALDDEQVAGHYNIGLGVAYP